MNRIIWTAVGMMLALTVGVVAAPQIKEVLVVNTIGEPVPVMNVGGAGTYQFVGFTSESVPFRNGLEPLNAACQDFTGVFRWQSA